VLTDEKMRASIAETQMSEDEFLLLSYRLGYGIVALVAILYPGGMALFYYRRRLAVAEALREE